MPSQGLGLHPRQRLLLALVRHRRVPLPAVVRAATVAILDARDRRQSVSLHPLTDDDCLSAANGVWTWRREFRGSLVQQ
jgi:hypothetical protein